MTEQPSSPPGAPQPTAGATHVVTWLDDPRATDVARAGGKGAGLARLRRAGLPVPDGFVVEAEAYRHFVAVSGLAPLVEQVTADLDGRSADALAGASARLRAAFEAAPVPGELAGPIVAAWRRLGGEAVAVRSSATTRRRRGGGPAAGPGPGRHRGRWLRAREGGARPAGAGGGGGHPAPSRGPAG